MTIFLLKDSNLWVDKFQYRKKSYRRQGFESKSEAKAWIEATRAELRAGVYRPEQTRITSFASLANAYLEDCKIKRMGRNTRRAKLRCYRLFAWYANGDIYPDVVGKTLYKDFLAWVVTHPKDGADGHKTANRYLRDLNALFNWAVDGDHLTRNPVRGIKPFAEDPAVKYIPPIEDINKVILAADPEETDRLVCILHLAARIGEIRLLTWEDVNFERRQVRLWTRKRRGGERQSDWMAMTEMVHLTLRSRWERRNKQSVYVFCRENGEPFTRDMWSKAMPHLCVRASVKPFGYHAIRHHVASLLRDSGKATVGQIQKFLRHQRQTTTETYLHELRPERQAMAGLLDGLLEGKKPDKQRSRIQTGGEVGGFEKEQPKKKSPRKCFRGG